MHVGVSVRSNCAIRGKYGGMGMPLLNLARELNLELSLDTTENLFEKFQ